MRKLSLIFLLTGTLAFSACGDDQSNQTAPTAPKAPATQTAPQTPDTSAKPTAKTSSTTAKMEKPGWAILEQSVYHYPE